MSVCFLCFAIKAIKSEIDNIPTALARRELPLPSHPPAYGLVSQTVRTGSSFHVLATSISVGLLLLGGDHCISLLVLLLGRDV